MTHPLSTYTQALADEIVEWVSEGRSLRAYCRQAGKPGKSTITDWRKAHPEFDERFLEARQDGWHEIANRARNTARGKKDEEGGDSSGDVQRDKLIIETDLKLLAKWFPTKYGDKIDVNHGGQVNANLTVTFVGGKPGASGDPVP